MSYPQPPLHPLYKQHSWEEVWFRRRKSNYLRRRCNNKSSSSVTDDDLDELKACIELGFGFGPDTLDLDPKLSDTLPALKFYCAVNKEYSNSLSRTTSSSSILSGRDSASSSSDTSTVFYPSDDPETMKMRLKQWARVVAFSVQQLSRKLN